MSRKEHRSPLVPSSPRDAPFRDYGFQMPESTLSRDNIFAHPTTIEENTEPVNDDLGLLSDTLARLDAEIERDTRRGLISSTKTAPSNLDLLSGAMKRIATLEAQLKEANRRLIKAESLKIQKVERSDREIALENDRLRQQVAEMEGFLADYGLIWVGDEDCEEKEPEEPGRVNWNKILANIEELNQLAPSRKMATDNNVAKLADNSPTLRLGIYADGVLLGAGPFRPLGQCELLLRDLADGFFPSELQAKYPDGVFFEVEDRRESAFDRMFPGRGQRVGKSEDTEKPKVGDLLEIAPLVREGQILDERIRSRPPTARTMSSGPVATLRVKLFDGTNQIVKLRFAETLSEARAQLTGLRDAYVFLAHDGEQWAEVRDEHLTLSELKLTPRAALQLRRRPAETKSQIISNSIRDIASQT